MAPVLPHMVDAEERPHARVPWFLKLRQVHLEVDHRLFLARGQHLFPWLLQSLGHGVLL